MLSLVENLLSEKIDEQNIIVTGNTVIDSLYWVLERLESDAHRAARLQSFLNNLLPFDWMLDRFVLITGHRRESFGDGIVEICEALRDLSCRFRDMQFVYPLHLNPNIQSPVRKMLDHISNITLIDPLDYEPFVYLLKHSYMVLTDSGGIQEEAPSLGKPVLVMRDVTERPEAVNAGTVELVGTEKCLIVDGVSRLIQNKSHYLKMAKAHNPYGDGNACGRIIQALQYR